MHLCNNNSLAVSQHFLKLHLAPEEIQGTADGHIQMVLAKLFQVSEVVKASHTAGVSDGDFPPAAQYFCQLFFSGFIKKTDKIILINYNFTENLGGPILRHFTYRDEDGICYTDSRMIINVNMDKLLKNYYNGIGMMSTNI